MLRKMRARLFWGEYNAATALLDIPVRRARLSYHAVACSYARFSPIADIRLAQLAAALRLRLVARDDVDGRKTDMGNSGSERRLWVVSGPAEFTATSS
jgi:hypothetical protein